MTEAVNLSLLAKKHTIIAHMFHDLHTGYVLSMGILGVGPTAKPHLVGQALEKLQGGYNKLIECERDYHMQLLNEDDKVKLSNLISRTKDLYSAVRT